MCEANHTCSFSHFFMKYMHVRSARMSFIGAWRGESSKCWIRFRRCQIHLVLAQIKPWLMTNNIVSIISDCHGLLTSIKKFCWFSCEGFPPFSVSLYCSNRSQLWTKSCFQMIPIHFFTILFFTTLFLTLLQHHVKYCNVEVTMKNVAKL